MPAAKMLDEKDLYDLLMEYFEKLKNVPPDLHLLCPKVNDDDFQDYDAIDNETIEDVTPEEKRHRIEAAKSRQDITYHLCLLMGLDPGMSGTWLTTWAQRVESFLIKCDRCVINWHRGRGPFLKIVMDLFDEGIRDIMESKLNDFDKDRIDAGLQEAKQVLQKNGPMNTAKLARQSLTSVLALFEALCSMAYLSSPEHRVNFNYVFEKTQQKKPLRMQGGILPTMTHFLFDSDRYRNTFAREAWENLQPDSLTQETWDWAVHDNLKETILEASFSRGFPTPAKIVQFWQGFLLILNALTEDQVIHLLGSMDVQPSVYLLALDHTRTDSDEALGVVMKGLRALMEKSSKAFWAAYEQVTPNQLAETIFTSPAFRSSLAQSLAPEMMVDEGGTLTPALAAWVEAFLRSLPISRRTELCEFLLRHLFDKFRLDASCAEDGQATCTLAGLKALRVTLDGFLDIGARVDTGTSLIYINTIINLVVKYKDVITGSAELRPGDRGNIGLSSTAASVIQCSLALDSKAIRVEWNGIHETGGAQQTLQRQSDQVWETFTELLWPGRTELAKGMLTAIMPLRSIEPFRPEKGQDLNEPQRRFNERYAKTASAIAMMLRRLSDFNPADLHVFCAEPASQTILPIVASLMNADDAIKEAGIDLIKAVTGEAGRSDAVAKMLEDYFNPFLDAFSRAIKDLTVDKDSNNPFSPVPSILQLSTDINNALCDPSVGLLRSKSLTLGELGAITRWWDAEWQCLNHSLKMIRFWHEKIDKKILEDFFRTAMEVVDHFLAQDGLMVSVLSEHSGFQAQAGLNSDPMTAAMRTVLNPPRVNSVGIVDMLLLRDTYLISLTVKVLVKLLRRLKEQNLQLPPYPATLIFKTCKKTAAGDYGKKSNLTETQKAEILRSLGDDTTDDDIRILSSRTVGADKVKRQSTLDFSKGSTVTPAVRTNRDDVLDLTSSIDKHRSSLNAIKARQAVKPDPKALLATQTSIKEARAKEKAEKARRDADAIAQAKALRAPTRLVAGEGSGMSGVSGVRGKDHSRALPKDQIMVGSSSEDDDSDEEDALKPKKNDGTMATRKPALLLAEKGPVKKVKVQRSAKDMRARLIPPMDVLHQAILEWDLFHDGNDPPNGVRCAKVANAYPHPHHYKETFLPLLIYEAWRSFVTAKDEATTKPFGIRIVNRMSVDKFLEVTTAMPVTQNRERSVAEGDIVIISKGQDPLNQSDVPHCLARIWKTTFKKDNLEVIYRLSGKNNPILSALLPGAEFHAVKITNMTTIEREYAALESLQYYDLMDEVLKAEPSPILQFGDQAVQDVMKNYHLNTGQAKAILNAKANDGFTLIQGPPGTGKTKTIVAMVGALLTGSIRPTNGAVAVSRPGGGQTGAQSVTKKLLVCAPSNAAVDELVLRLKDGVKTQNGQFHKIDVLRLGRSDAINAAVKDVTLDELVKARMQGELNKNGGVSEREQVHQQAGEIKQKLNDLRPALEAAREGADRAPYLKLQREFDELKRRQAHIGARIDAAKDGGNTFAREAEIKRRAVQQEILDKAQVLCATLSGSGHEMFKNLNVEFETVIIDEAAQCVELSALIPLKYGCSKCILVGDPKQLPPTVLSQSAARFGYDQSLFVRMQQNHPEDVHLLDKQYRMHPEISLFPSQEFYEGRLEDGADMAQLRHQPWHRSDLLGPYRFFDVRGVQERGHRGQSLVNTEELRVAMQLYQRFRTDYSKIDLKGKIGIITPYKAQLFALRQRFTERYGEGITEHIEFNTTDAFQGRECEIIIFSCVRASPTGGIGFMTDIRRMNVGLTRAKSSLWVLGDSRALVQGEFWSKLIQDAKRRDRYSSGDILGLLKTPGAMSSSAYSSPGPETRSPSPAVMGQQLRRVVELTDSEMSDASNASIETPSSRSADPPLTKNKSLQRPPAQHPLAHQNPAPLSVVSSRPYRESPVRIEGVNESGEALPFASNEMNRPVIHTSAEPEVHGNGAAGKKRLLEAADANHPAAKRILNAPSVLSKAPRAPKLMKQPKPPTDPSAMQVLGLVPPQRPQPVPQHIPAPQPPQGGPTRPADQAAAQGQSRTNNIPRRPAADPFIRRKPNKR